jgi:hypothetical protein
MRQELLIEFKHHIIQLKQSKTSFCLVSTLAEIYHSYSDILGKASIPAIIRLRMRLFHVKWSHDDHISGEYGLSLYGFL